MTKNKNKNIPTLRFPEFKDSVNVKSFDNIFTFSTGKNIKQQEASHLFETPCVRYGELYHMYSEVINEVINRTNLDKSELKFSKGDEILLPSAGEDPLDIGSASALKLKDIAIGRTINILRPKNKEVYSPEFASYYINQKLKKEISSLAKGVSISNVYNSDLRKLSINLPSLSEQQKIASFLTAVDSKIELLQKKKQGLEQYKKGVMQQIFSQKMRFKDDKGNNYPDWKEMRLGELLEYVQPTQFIVESTEYNDDYNTPVLTAGKSFILGYTDETDNIYSDKLPVIIFDDFTTSSQFVDFKFKVKSSAMKIIVANEGENIKYIFEALQDIRYETGGHGRHWISVFSKLKIPYPCIEEQTKIANFISAIDAKITLVNTQLENTQQFKKGLLQQLFV